MKGVSRLLDNPQAVLVWMTRSPTDDELRKLQDYLRDEDLPTADAVRGILNT